MKEHVWQRKKNNGERSSVGLLQGHDDYEKLETADMEDNASQLGNSVGWVSLPQDASGPGIRIAQGTTLF